MDKKATAGQAFDHQLKLALRRYGDPEWLGEHSPLATTYFLGDMLPTSEAARSLSGRGEALREALALASNDLWGDGGPRTRRELEAKMAELLQVPGSGAYHYLVLELRYFRRFFRPRRTGDIWESFLGLSRAQFYRELEAAVQALGEALLRRMQPTFRPEEPLPPARLFGRDEVQARSLRALLDGGTVSISGPGGIGKTALGAAIAANWPERRVFWFTARPTLNDDLASLLFSLGIFLHRQGASSLWQKLLADQGKVEDFNLALGLVREDLARLGQARPLLVLDEVDRLRTADQDNPAREHVQILAFLEELRGQAPLLLLGQRAVMDGDLHLVLAGLERPSCEALLRSSRFTFSQGELNRLLAYTGGNPRLLQLCLMLGETRETLAEVLDALPRTPALEPLFDRLWSRCGHEERQALAWLSIFRSPVPAETAPGKGGFKHLLARELIQQDRGGALTMWPALKALIYRELPAESRERLHARAAFVRAERAEFTAAAYHACQAGAIREAVQLWFPLRRQEISRGQGAAALRIFREVSLERLPRREREALALMRAELKQLAGDLAGGLEELSRVNWLPDGEITLQARELEGYFLQARGYPDDALARYEDGLALATRIRNRLITFRNRRGRLHVRQRNMSEAWREARLGRMEAHNLEGVILSNRGEYAEAQVAYEQALAIAEALDHPAGMAQAHYDLAALFAFQGRLDEMLAHSQEAMGYYERIGDRMNMEMVRINLAGAYIQAGRFAEAAAAARQALPFFERVNDPYGRATAAANLAEASYELGDLETAERYAHYVLQQEERHTHPYALYTLGQVHRTCQRVEQAAHAFRAAAEIAEANEDRFMLAYARRALGEVAGPASAEGQSLLASALDLFRALGLADEAARTVEGMKG